MDDQEDVKYEQDDLVVEVDELVGTNQCTVCALWHTMLWAPGMLIIGKCPVMCPLVPKPFQKLRYV